MTHCGRTHVKSRAHPSVCNAVANGYLIKCYRSLIYNIMFKKWHVSFHLATHPAILQSRVYKNKIFCIFLNHD